MLRWLLAGVVAHPMRAAPKCPGGREVVDRQRLDPVLLRELYQDRRWSSPQIAAHLALTLHRLPAGTALPRGRTVRKILDRRST